MTNPKSGLYDVYETIVVPPCEGLKISGEIYTLRWRGSANGDLIRIDSAKDCNFSFGLLYYPGSPATAATGAAMRFQPQNPLPDGSAASMTGCFVNVASIIGPGASAPATRQSFGVVFGGKIVSNDFYFTDILNMGTNIASTSSAEFAHNRIKCMDLRTNTINGTVMYIGSESKQNIFKVSIGVDQAADNVTGVDIFGTNNSFEVITKGGFKPGGDIVFGAPASGNQVNLIPNSSVTDALSLISDNATNPTNQIICAGPPLPKRTVNATAGTFNYTHSLYPATARVTGGSVSSIRLIRGSTTIYYEATQGDIVIGAGDRLQVISTAAPTIEIIPIKTR
ncbi:MAG: hypothetical protein HYY29_01385 [Chloroflexi bacterium]|nr:hypothetical protein [Chloroflexota bacterium]